MEEFRYEVAPAPGYSRGDGTLEFPQYFGKLWTAKVVKKLFSKHKVQSVGIGSDPFTIEVCACDVSSADNKVRYFLDELVDKLVDLESTNLRFKIKRKGNSAEIIGKYSKN